MTTRTPTEALAEVAAALVHDQEITGVLARLLHDCVELLPVTAAAILVRNAADELELLSATSHGVAHLELYQAQRESGPCVDASRAGEATFAVGADTVVARWPDVGREIVDAGFQAVHAFPLLFREHALGGLGLFSTGPEEFDHDAAVLAQSMADLATLTIVQPAVMADDELTRHVSLALEGRIVVEQAKGVLAQQLGLGMAEAYDELITRTRSTGSTLARVAQDVVHAAHQR
ncbi:GAF and ANTAR domain-containing protein [Cellulomonas fengjieae]|uniref:GAF and ANTAR domain-containing protein n=1 Tax=Cellulomonas fengjieae TaxID=2819978 RepID=A0ABS3SIA8_9CELL|nr:GAF and ANTAR domain-containing protein [Cellulomonas fengjieae]MBO3085481.1 GAF and ANTAR domain-containing protein [Cellulomonas fengjieae]MBO3102565.1 GAF and ANTAR domain-containing protein [Cellulomonas fengjieae]QVI64472.1 GAF and ANTAR domain-containing protein [Cellulomonas fengjieae]